MQKSFVWFLHNMLFCKVTCVIFVSICILMPQQPLQVLREKNIHLIPVYQCSVLDASKHVLQ